MHIQSDRCGATTTVSLACLLLLSFVFAAPLACGPTRHRGAAGQGGPEWGRR